MGTARPRKVYKALDLGSACTYGVHNNNHKNALRAVLERVFLVKKDGLFVEPPVPGQGVFKHRLRKFRRRILAQRVSTPRLTETQFLEQYSGRKLAVYTNAVESRRVREVDKSDAIVSGFLKAEKVNITAKPDPTGRLISPRSPRYNVAVGVYIKPLEHMLYDAIDGVYGAPTVAKGKNALQRGAMIREAWDDLTNPVALFMDASRFDQHVSRQALEWEHGIYLSCHDNERELRQLLGWQLRNVGYVRTPDGVVKYEVDGTRASGDMNTSLGNVLLMCAMMHAYLSTHCKHPFRLVNDGDDCVVMVESADAANVRATCKGWFTEMGFTMKYEGETREFEEIEFCQAQPVYNGQAWVMCRDPRLVIDKDLTSVLPLATRKQWEHHTSSVALCGLALAGDMPIFGALYELMLIGRGERRLVSGMDYLARGMTGGRRRPTEAARASFDAAFGITPDEQMALERYYDTIRPAWKASGGPRGNTPEEHTDILRR